MRVFFWSSVWFDGELDAESGKVRRRFLTEPRKTREGFVGAFDVERPVFGWRTPLAIYAQDGSLFFSAGRRKWNLSKPGLKFSHHVLGAKLLSRFCVLEDDRIAWQITYLHPLRTLSAIIDPTYDSIELENDHFLSFVAESTLSPTWQADTLRRWSTEVAAGSQA